MTVSVASFRQTFGVFNNTGDYPDAAVSFWLTNGQAFLDPALWGAQVDLGVSLYVAHHLALDARDRRAVAAGGIPGELKGPATQKSVDKVSQGYDTKAVTWENSAFWNQTRYGTQLINMARQFGPAGVQLGPTTQPGVVGPIAPFVGPW